MAILSVFLFVTSLAALVRIGLTPSFPFYLEPPPGPAVIGGVSDRPDSAADQLLRGDRIITVNGTPVCGAIMARHYLHIEKPGSEVRLQLERDGEKFEATVRSRFLAFYRMPEWVALALFNVVSWLVIALIFTRRPRDPVGVLTALAGGVGLNAICLLDPGLGYGSLAWRIAWTIFFAILVGFEAPLFLHWCLRYPVRHTLPPWLLPALYTVCAAGIAASVVTLIVQVPAGNFEPIFIAVQIQFGIATLVVLTAIGILVRTYARSLSPQNRLQVKWVMLGVCVGILPETLLVMVPKTLGLKGPVPHVYINLCLLAIPLGFLASILRYRLFDVDLIAGRFTVLGAFLFLAVLVRTVLAALDLPAAMDNQGSQWAAALILVGFPTLIFRRHLDQLVGIPGAWSQEIQQRLSTSLAQGGEPRFVARRSLELIIDAMKIERGAIFLHDPLTDCFTCVHVAGFEHLDRSELTFRRGGQLATWVSAQSDVVRTRAYDRPLGLHAVNERELLDRLDSAVVIPLRSSRRLIGMISIGSHSNGNLPNTAVVRLIAQLGQKISEVLASLAAERSTLPFSSSTPAVASFPTDDDPAGRERSTIGPYRLDKLIGVGESGAVWRARHRIRRRDVALKELRRHHTDPRAFRRFLDEIAMLTQIDDPHVVRILDYGNNEGVPWFAMELVKGETLAHRLERVGVLGLAESLDVAAQVASGLSACHEVGVVHRDVKPANILLSGASVRLADLGLARWLDPVAMQSQSEVAGTPLYMSPEQVANKAVSYESDMFSLGAILYECLCGRAAFEGGSLAATVANVGQARFQPAGQLREDLPQAVDEVVCGLLEKEPGERPGPASSVARQLARLSRMSYRMALKQGA